MLARKITALVGLPSSGFSGVCRNAQARGGPDCITFLTGSLFLDAAMTDGMPPSMDLLDGTAILFSNHGVGVEVLPRVNAKDFVVCGVGEPLEITGLDGFVKQAIV